MVLFTLEVLSPDLNTHSILLEKVNKLIELNAIRKGPSNHGREYNYRNSY